jgi:hypothetical protein
VSDCGDRKAKFSGKLMVGLAFEHATQDQDLASHSLASSGLITRTEKLGLSKVFTKKIIRRVIEGVQS